MELGKMLVLLLFLCSLQCSGTDGWTRLRFRVTGTTVKNGKSGFALVSSVLVTEFGKLLMADYLRNEVKMVSLDQPNTILSTVRTPGNPDSLLQLLDGRVMVCFRGASKLVILSVAGDTLTLNATLSTERSYAGLALYKDDKVLASSTQDGGVHGRLDVVDLTGAVRWTVLNDTEDSYPSMHYLRRWGEDVYLSDHDNNKVRAVNIHTGSVQETFGGFNLSSLQLREPRDLHMDHHGNMYLSVLRSKLCDYCVIQISQAGRARALSWVKATRQSYPYGITTTPTLLVVSWWQTMGGESEVTAYGLPF